MYKIQRIKIHGETVKSILVLFISPVVRLIVMFLTRILKAVFKFWLELCYIGIKLLWFCLEYSDKFGNTVLQVGNVK